MQPLLRAVCCQTYETNPQKTPNQATTKQAGTKQANKPNQTKTHQTILGENPTRLGQIFNFQGIFCLHDNYVAALLCFKWIEMEIWIHVELDQNRGYRI